MNVPELSRGSRQLGWTSCLTSAGRVTLASETTFLHINAIIIGHGDVFSYLIFSCPETIIKHFVTNLNEHKHSITVAGISFTDARFSNRQNLKEMPSSDSCITYKFLK